MAEQNFFEPRMLKRVNLQWTSRLRELLDANLPIDETTGYNPAIKWLVAELSCRNRPYKLYQLGAGVKRITTETENCPFCKKRLDA